MSELSVVEVQRLEALESVIDAGMQTFVHVGNALLEIRDNRLYRNTHRTFEKYCRERWGVNSSRARQLIDAAEVVENLKSVTAVTLLPAVEKHARPLTSLPPEQQPAVWQRAVETAPNGKITQAHVQAVVDKHREEERTSSDEYCDEEDDQDSDYVYQGGLARCKYCWKIHDKWEPSADTPPSVRWVCEYCDHATADANMDLRQPEPDDNAAATHTPDVDDEHREEEVVEKSKPQPHVAYNTGNNEWYTPAEYVESARQLLGEIDLDPASSETANAVVGAKTIYTANDDGLAQHWFGRVWMNPPYASGLIERFSEKLVTHYKSGDVSQAIVLVNNATETAWFHQMAAVAQCICFPRGRIRFWQPSGTLGAPLQGQSIIYMGQNAAGFVDVFKKFGLVVML